MENLIKYLKGLGGKKALVLTHHNADIDAIASSIGLSLGLKQLGIKCSVGAAESVSKAAKKIVGKNEIIIDPECNNFDSVILVDTSVEEQLKGVKNLRADAVIDHHPKGKLVKEAKTDWIEPETKSSSQMVYRLLKKMKCEVTKEMAKTLSAGIVADTAHLRIADADVFETLTELLRTGIEFEEVLRSIETPIDQSEAIASLKAAQRSSIYKIDDLLMCVSKVSSHEAPASRALIKIGADVAIVATVRKDEVRISSRAKEKILKYGIDLSVIFEKAGKMIGGNGGGHNMAGSANGKDTKAVDDALKFILKEISKKTGKEIKKID